MVLFPVWGKGGGKEEENKEKSVLRPAFLVPESPGSSLACLPGATAVLTPVSQYLCSLLNPLYAHLCGFSFLYSGIIIFIFFF